MKLKARAILVSAIIHTAQTGAALAVGMLLLGHLLTETNQDLISLKLSHLQHEIDEKYYQLQSQGLQDNPDAIKVAQDKALQCVPKFGFRKTGEFYIFNNKGQVLATSDSNATPKLLQDILSSPVEQSNPNLSHNQSHIWLRVPEERWGWTLAASITRHEAYYQYLFSYLIQICLIGSIIAISGTWLAYHRFKTSYINRVQAALRCVKRIKEHDLNARIALTPKVDDEITHLQHGINDMIAEIQQHRNNLEEQVALRTQQLHEAKEAAEEGFRTKTRFLANMSHELRTPLNAILGFSQLMSRDQALTSQQQENLGIINHAGEHLLGFINDILDMSKIESNMITLNPSVFNPRVLLHDMTKMFRMRTEAKGLKFELEIDEEIPNAIENDEGKLRQILINLINNAIKFTEQGSIKLSAYRISIDSLEPRLCFDVFDSGIGIPPEQQHRIFNPFEQVNNGSFVEKGTGLGLAISREYSQLMGGNLCLQSQPSRGTLFSLVIPCREMTDTSKPSTESPQRILRLAEGQAPKRILVAEDNPDNRNLLVQLLKTVGFEVQAAENGQAAIDLWQQWQPDLIWMDIRMPKLNGLEATAQIRRCQQGRQPIIIALSASVLNYDKQAILDQGCDDYLPKPFKEQDLLQMMGHYLDIQFKYETSTTAANPMTIKLENQHLQDLPPDWVKHMMQAAVQGDQDAMGHQLKGIASSHPELHQALGLLVADYEFNQIKNLMQQATQHCLIVQEP